MLRDKITRLDGTFYSFLDLDAGGYLVSKRKKKLPLIRTLAGLFIHTGRKKPNFFSNWSSFSRHMFLIFVDFLIIFARLIHPPAQRHLLTNQPRQWLYILINITICDRAGSDYVLIYNAVLLLVITENKLIPKHVFRYSVIISNYTYIIIHLS